jgi:hypothetical protein
MKSRTRSLIGASIGALALTAFGAVESTATAQEVGTVAITGVDIANDMVHITNSGGADLDVNGLILCNFPLYAPIVDAPVIAAGETIIIPTGLPLGADEGELGLYLSQQYENPDEILSYVEWGSTGHTRSPVAVGATIWDGEAVEAASSLSASVDAPVAAAEWTGTVAAAPELAETGSITWVLLSIALGLVALGLGVGAWSKRDRQAMA